MFSSRAASFATKTGVRAFSTPAAAAANHAPPKKLIGTIGRYASALYTAASKVGNKHYSLPIIYIAPI